MCGGQAIGKQQYARSEQHRENQKAEDGGDEPSPNCYRQPRQRHALGARVGCSDDEIECVERGGDAERRDREEPEGQTGFRWAEKRGDHADYARDGKPEAQTSEARKRHLAGADLRGQEIGAEAGLRSAGQHNENHQRAVNERERSVGVW